jgi:hypothetical protein
MSRQALAEFCFSASYVVAAIGLICTFMMVRDGGIIAIGIGLFGTFLSFLMFYALGTILETLDTMVKKQDSQLSHQMMQMKPEGTSNGNSNLLS